jgi:glycerophosphoryl diester phosphodiesterase
MDLIFGIFPIFFILMFCFVFGMIISTVIKGAKQNRQNNNSPRITAEAEVVTKRTKVWGDHSHTVYFATFQFESGDRLELEIPHNQFGYLVEGDKGKLTFQGNRFMSFERM